MTFSGMELPRVPPCSKAWIRDSKNNTFWLKGPCSAEVSLNEHGARAPGECVLTTWPSWMGWWKVPHLGTPKGAVYSVYSVCILLCYRTSLTGFL